MTGPVIILGASGMLGHALQKIYPEAIRVTHRDFDITNKKDVYALIGDSKNSIVLNSAAYTNVEASEDNIESAFAVNADGPEYIAAACKKSGSMLVHFSSDYVFDGTKKEFDEYDIPHPINTYGKSKFAGEVNIRKNMEDFRIIRTSWLFGECGKNFIDTIISLSKHMDTVKVVSDQFGSPTYTKDLSEKIPELISREPGIYHITNAGSCSWFELASEIIPNAVPCATTDCPTKVNRPKYSVLMNTKTSPLRPWRDAVIEFLKINGWSQ